jgi:hypothetical protein
MWAMTFTYNQQVDENTLIAWATSSKMLMDRLQPSQATGSP